MKIPYIFKTLLFISLTFIVSCSTDSIEAVADASEVLERVDMQIEGDINMDIFQTSLESENQVDLVQYDYLGGFTNSINFEIELEHGYLLKINLVNDHAIDLYRHVGLPYNLYAAQELDDKDMYVIMSVAKSNGFETPDFTSLVVGNHGVSINAFTIVDCNYFTKEMLCRIENVILRNPFNLDNSITLNGTFRGAVTF